MLLCTPLLAFSLYVKAEEFLTKSVPPLHYRTDEVKSCTYQRHVFCFDTDCIFAGTGVVCNSRLLVSHSNNLLRKWKNLRERSDQRSKAVS